MATPAPAGHRRNKSSSVLKSIMVTKNHKRSPSDGTSLSGAKPDARPYNPNAFVGAGAPLLPLDHPHSQLRAANRTQNIPTQPSSSPRKSQETKASPTKGLHKKTLSSVSLRSLGRDKERERDTRTREPSRTRGEDTTRSPKKTKSSTNLAGLFGKGKQPKEVKEPKQVKDKENSTPPSSSNAFEAPHTPIWAQFSSQQPLQEITTTSKVPLNDRRISVEEEIALFTPGDYSPSKQRNFFDYGQPSLQKKSPTKERPKSVFLSATTSSASLLETLARKKSSDRVPLGDTKGNEGRVKENGLTKSITTGGLIGRSSSETSRESRSSSPKKAVDTSKKPNRVMAAVAAFNGKSRNTGGTPTTSPTKLDPNVVDTEFEAVLESRNIPTHQRAAMRTLKLEVKADFVRTHKLDTPQSSRAPSAHSTVGAANGNQTSKPTLTRSANTHDGSMEEGVQPKTGKAGESSKRERPRSRTFTFSKGDSPTKKQRAEAASSKSAIIPKSPSSRSLASTSSQRSVSKGSKSVKPSEFISYLRKNPKPQLVEVGKLHKLRLLLRNETVDWVNQFVEEGGMTELVGLLHRTMEVEWREEHEDTLLHEVLRCLKGLCTTDSALKQFVDIAPTLFPALLGMLFDEEHKGPSEFTTRELIIQIIFAHISMAPEVDLPSRATELLKYLKDPVKEKESSTIPFILQMHQPRPYQVWCKEITNVTKEVFWIFIHHLTVVPMPIISDEPPKSYAKTHFPGQRAIVPAAPYVGGVEWDATNYIATHLDLLNGLLASLPTRDIRNTLRSELKVSGFEKVMGHLRTCNPKYYGAVHDAVRVWIGAAMEDGWEIRDVRMGPPDGKPGVGSPIKQSPKKKAEVAPQIQAPKMDVGSLGLGFEKEAGGEKKDDFWL